MSAELPSYFIQRKIKIDECIATKMCQLVLVSYELSMHCSYDLTVNLKETSTLVVRDFVILFKNSQFSPRETVSGLKVPGVDATRMSMKKTHERSKS